MFAKLAAKLSSLTPAQRRALYLLLAGVAGAVGALTGVPLDAIMSLLTPLLGP